MSQEEYVSVRVSTLRGDQQVPFKVYLRVGERYILYVRQGEAFDGKRLKKIKEKRLKKMFILPVDEENYRSYITQNIESAYDKNSDMTAEARSSVVQGHQQSQAEELMENFEDEAVYNETKTNASKYVEYLMSETDALKGILDMDQDDGSVGHHGVTVATYAVALANKMELPENDIKDLTLGCLVHDIAQAQPDCPRPSKAIDKLSQEEIEKYQMHPKMGAEQVKDLSHFEESIVRIIFEHEETIDGNGYPNGLDEKRIHPLALIAGVANAMERTVREKKITRAEAAKQLLIDQMGKYPLEHLQMMQTVVKEIG